MSAGIFPVIKGAQRIQLTTSMPSVSRLAINCWSLETSQTNETPQTVTGWLYLMYFIKYMYFMYYLIIAVRFLGCKQI
jgi:hypothetical protein